jgi:hypothetical protein
VAENDLPIKKLASITTDSAPSMVGKHKGFVNLCHNDETFPFFFSYHCILHQQVLCGQIIKMGRYENCDQYCEFDTLKTTAKKKIQSVYWMRLIVSIGNYCCTQKLDG